MRWNPRARRAIASICRSLARVLAAPLDATIGPERGRAPAGGPGVVHGSMLVDEDGCNADERCPNGGKKRVESAWSGGGGEVSESGDDGVARKGWATGEVEYSAGLGVG